MKLYNKKRFVQGLLFLVLTIILIITEIISIKDGNLNFIKIIKDSGISIIALCLSIGMILISLDKSANEQSDIEKNDERNQSINLHVNKAVNNIMTFIYCIFMILFMIIWYNYKSDLLLIPIIIFGLLISISFIANIICYIYYERKL